MRSQFSDMGNLNSEDTETESMLIALKSLASNSCFLAEVLFLISDKYMYTLYIINCKYYIMGAASRPRIAPSLLLASQTSTPRYTPPSSPPIQSASVSPTRTSKPVSPRRHSVSFSTSRGLDDRSSMFSSANSSQHSSVSGLDSGSQSGEFLSKIFFV